MTHPPHPGSQPQPQPAKKKSPIALFGCLGCSGLILVILVAVGIMALGSDGDSSRSDDGAASADTADDAGDSGDSDEAADDMYGLNERVELGDLAFTVTGVEGGIAETSDILGDYTAEGQYVAVSITAENIGTEPTYFENTGQKLYDAEGRQFGHDTDATIAMDDGPMLGELNPGQSGDFTVVFDIPADAEFDHIELGDSLFGDGENAAVNLRG
ncbi:DUF4352 domain-containing protein [Nocardiopsis metallicus]|uniref:DUF4352 domain-containing protein n=1 Tax=Nocardiopsis metallicus TaxID=179819 RepID=A0A840WDF4_9ACTN|nr:DUF4352 domain-containing protein [Nocardiopsis metallicus]MBB5495029.1 hypothetical protein [Nocardiopsis metallicus]